MKLKEHKGPNQVYKVPVQTCFFNHFVMAALVKMSQFCFIYIITFITTAKYVEPWKPVIPEEITAKSNGAGIVYMQVACSNQFICSLAVLRRTILSMKQR